MSTDYHAIAGQSLERLAALSDGVFAIAMTLLVLDLRVPVRAGLQSEGELWVALPPLAPRLVVYGLSFVTLGIFWIGQRIQLSSFAHSNRTLTWIHLSMVSSRTLPQRFSGRQMHLKRLLQLHRMAPLQPFARITLALCRTAGPDCDTHCWARGGCAPIFARGFAGCFMCRFRAYFASTCARASRAIRSFSC